MDKFIVAFKGNRKGVYINPEGPEINIDDFVIVQAERGEDYGRVVGSLKDSGEAGEKESELPKIIRLGNDSDRGRMMFNRQKETETFYECLNFIDKHKLKMKLVDIEYQFDCNKITFFFTAEKRVDFRELVKDLAATYRTRIELRQIGVRDEAKRVDGYGICGKRQCCSAWLNEFSTITTQMARNQNLALNPQKLSGNCGRLLCCLRYEIGFYDEVTPQYPRVGARCMTNRGPGRIIRSDIFNEEIRILLDEAGELKMSLVELRRARNRGNFRIISEEPVETGEEDSSELEKLEG
ncbi:MAG: stage 0 sporulation protein [Candidatus Zixiibacteriota bacterium]|nr:MAG: stage 0 sporulation protein [candidate division Zixibacteria bacterium]